MKKRGLEEYSPVGHRKDVQETLADWDEGDVEGFVSDSVPDEWVSPRGESHAAPVNSGGRKSRVNAGGQSSAGDQGGEPPKRLPSVGHGLPSKGTWGTEESVQFRSKQEDC